MRIEKFHIHAKSLKNVAKKLVGGACSHALSLYSEKISSSLKNWAKQLVEVS